MSLLEKAKKFEEEGKAFFNYAEKVPNFNTRKAFAFKKGKVKKSFKSEGLQL